MANTSKPERKQQNHRNATGPRTARGKSISSKNARTHGLLSKELILSPEDKPALEHLRRSLRDELKPSSALLIMLGEDIIVNCWDLKMCIRRKNEHLKQMNAEPTGVNGSSTLSVADLRGDWNTQRRLRLLQELKQTVTATGCLTDRWKEPLIDAFGNDFYDLLMKWHPTEGVYLLFTEAYLQKDEMYHFRERPPEDRIAAAAEKQARREAPLRKAAVMKLIEMKEQSLISQASVQAVSQPQNSDPLELFQRYETTARRNLHRAIREYIQVTKDVRFLCN